MLAVKDVKDLRHKQLVFSIVNAVGLILEEDRRQKYPLFLKVEENFLLNFLKAIMNNVNSSFLVSVSGESGSGKTTFVNSVVKSNPIFKNSNVYTPIHCDDYYKDCSKELQLAGNYENLFKTGFSFDTPDAVDLGLLHHHLHQLKSGIPVKSPKYDFVTCKSEPNSTFKKPARLLLGEGLYLLNEVFDDVIDVRVYVYTPFDVIKDRWYKRAFKRGKTGEAADMQFLDVNSCAKKYIRPYMNGCNVIVSGLASPEYIQQISNKIFYTIKNILAVNG